MSAQTPTRKSSFFRRISSSPSKQAVTPNASASSTDIQASPSSYTIASKRGSHHDPLAGPAYESIPPGAAPSSVQSIVYHTEPSRTSSQPATPTRFRASSSSYSTPTSTIHPAVSPAASPSVRSTVSPSSSHTRSPIYPALASPPKPPKTSGLTESRVAASNGDHHRPSLNVTQSA
jgi:hypothetical protein